MSEPQQDNLTRIRRAHQRGHYDRETIDALLDALPLCHVGYVIDGQPLVTPTLQWREGDYVYWHGSSASRALKSSQGMNVCLTVSALDGLVLARSAFHHSANYRSVMVFGQAELIEDEAHKTASLKRMIDHFYPGRWDELRPMTAQELKATMLLRLPLDRASAKVRTGGPVDDEADYELPIWAGHIPLETKALEPINDNKNLNGVSQPDHLNDHLFKS